MQDYSCLCTAVTICAAVFVPKLDLTILTPRTSKSGLNCSHLLHHVSYTHDPNLLTTDQQVAEIMQI